MMQDSIINKEMQEGFIKKICESEIVWGLQNGEEFAVTTSNEYEDEEGEPLEVICFWSERALALECAKNEWENHEPVEIHLDEFIENWCIGMANENLMAGANFDQNMSGAEIDPLELIVELDKELKMIGKEIRLKRYQRSDDLINEVKKILNE